MITDVAGVRAGHWTDEAGRTGCTVVLLPEGAVASGEVRGGAPGTREWALLSPERLVERVDAVVLAGGSAFGLAACDGVAEWCAENGIGLPTAGGTVPIVVGAVLFDLTEGDPKARPGPDAGRAACLSASAGPLATGQVGAGTGATTGAWRGPDARRPGGIGTASCRTGDLVVSALVAVNAYGDVVGDEDPEPFPEGRGLPNTPFGDGAASSHGPRQSTTIGVVTTNASLDKVGCLLLAQSGHNGLARALEPSHTRFDGDAIVAAATGEVEASVDLARVLTTRAVSRAVRAVRA